MAYNRDVFIFYQFLTCYSMEKLGQWRVSKILVKKAAIQQTASGILKGFVFHVSFTKLRSIESIVHLLFLIFFLNCSSIKSHNCVLVSCELILILLNLLKIH
jgi:hypothetical protein